MTLFWAAGRAYAIRLVATLGGAIALFWALGIVDAMGHARTGQGAYASLALLSLAAAFDEACLLLPSLCFIAALATTTAWARSGELEAAFCSGRSPFSMALPMASCAWVLGLLALVYQETSGQQVALWRREATTGGRLGGSALGRALGRHTAWVRSGDYIVNLPVRGQRLLQGVSFDRPTLYQLTRHGLVAVIRGDALVAASYGWEITHAHTYPLLREGFCVDDVLRVALPITATDLMALSADPATEPVIRLFRLAARRERAGLDAVGIRLTAYRRLSLGFLAPLWVALAGLLGFRPNRRCSLANTLGLASAILAVTLALGHLFRLLALAHVMPAGVAVASEPLACLFLVVAWIRLPLLKNAPKTPQPGRIISAG